MKPRQELISNPPRQSFKAFVRRCRAFTFQWHQHAAYELTLIVGGSGLRFVGDSVVDYRAPDLVLLGPNLPHAWRTHATSVRNHALILQFHHDFLGLDFFGRPELKAAAELLGAAGRGLAFSATTCQSVRPHMQRLLRATSGLMRIRELLACLECLAADTDRRSLASPAYRSSLRTGHEQRVTRACDYMAARLPERLSLGDVARHVHMSPSAFSRFFKRATGMTFVRYLQELRVGEACRRLMETDQRVLDICEAVGFNNLSNFNRRFLEMRHLTPRAFRKRFQEKGT